MYKDLYKYPEKFIELNSAVQFMTVQRGSLQTEGGQM